MGSGCHHLLPHHSIRPFAGLLEFTPASCPSFSQSVQDNLRGHTKLMATPFPQSLACFLLLWDKTVLINLLHLFLSLPCSSLQSHPSFMLKVLPGFSPQRPLGASGGHAVAGPTSSLAAVRASCTWGAGEGTGEEPAPHRKGPKEGYGRHVGPTGRLLPAGTRTSPHLPRGSCVK